MPVPGFRDQEEGILFPFFVDPTKGTQIFPVSGAVLLSGWSLREAGNVAPAQIDIIDGGLGGGQIVASISLLTGTSKECAAPGKGILIKSGLAVVINTGSVTGALWLRDI